MNIGQLLNKYPATESELLLAHVLRQPKEFLHLRPETKISAARKTKFMKLHASFAKGIPIAYILGYKYFYDLRFQVNRNVLIPRPESEWLVEQGMKYLRNNPNAKRVLDIGTGSGCLIISLAATTRTSRENISRTTRASGGTNNRPIQWLASDISRAALAVARQNNRRHKTPVKFIQTNLFKSVKGKFDLIMANLPYVPANIYQELRVGLKYEPQLALIDKSKGELLIHKFLADLSKYLTEDGQAVMEIDPRNKPGIEEFVGQNKLPLQIAFYRDYQKLWRYAVIKRFPH